MPTTTRALWAFFWLTLGAALAGVWLHMNEFYYTAGITCVAGLVLGTYYAKPN